MSINTVTDGRRLPPAFRAMQPENNDSSATFSICMWYQLMNREAMDLTQSKERCKDTLAGRKGEMWNYIIISKIFKSKKQTYIVWAGLDVLLWFPRRPKEGIRFPRSGGIKHNAKSKGV